MPAHFRHVLYAISSFSETGVFRLVTSPRPPYLAEGVVLLPEHRYPGLLAGDDLLVGEAFRRCPPPFLGGDGLGLLAFREPVPEGVAYPRAPKRGHVEAGVREDLDAGLPVQIVVDGVDLELLGELDRPVSREPDAGVRVQRGDLIRGERLPGHEENLRCLDGNRRSSISLGLFFINCPNCRVQFIMPARALSF